jgi:hypothetical protein
MSKRRRPYSKQKYWIDQFIKLLKSQTMSSIVTYSTDKKFDKVDNRPYAEVVIYGNNGTSKRFLCLVDTGADDIQIHENIAPQLDFDLLIEATVDYVETASGSKTKVYIMPKVKMKVEGKIIHEDLIFGNNNVPLIGRRTILTAYDIGFNPTRWMY